MIPQIALPKLVLHLALALLLLSSGSSTQEELEAAKREAAATLVAELEEVVAFCVKRKAYRQRDMTYGAILNVDGDHSEARRFLKYRFDKKTKTWVQGRYREPRAASEILETEVARMRERKVRLYSDRVFEAVLLLSKRLGHERTELEIEVLLELDPANPGIRAHRGEVRLELDGNTRWVARETIRARERRKRMKQRYKELLEEIELETAVVFQDEEFFGDWRARSTTGTVTCLATTDRAEADTVARTLDAAWSWFHEFLGESEVDLFSLRVYLLEKRADRERFIAEYPDLDESFREKMRSVESAWLGDERHFGCWQEDREVRLDMILRQTISLYFHEAYRIDHRQGWIEQGLGLYLTQRLVGTRRSFAVTRDERSSVDAAGLDAQLVQPHSDYFVLAEKTLAERNPRQFSISLGKNVNSMTSVDLVTSYAMSAFLIETQPSEVVHEIFERSGEAESPVQVFEEVLGLDLVQLRAKLLRWLGENSEKDW